MTDIKVAAIIVTYNRLQLLKEALEAVKNQATPVQEIIVVNNGSTDGTHDWLLQQREVKVIHQQNLGGSGGFYTGLKEAVQLHVDWIWLMDDDTICTQDTLQNLLEKIPFAGREKIGFLCSRVIWKDGTPHLMNLPDVKLYFNQTLPFTLYDKQSMLLAENCSFVSVLISAAAVKSVGLPYKDFYIWGDDQEYTRRITATGLLGLYCSDSVAMHKTVNNHRAYIYTDSPANLWKHSHGFRNEFFMVRKKKGVLYYLLYMAARLGYGSFKIIKTRKTDRLRFIGVMFRSAWKSFFFNPTVDKV